MEIDHFTQGKLDQCSVDCLIDRSIGSVIVSLIDLLIDCLDGWSID